jgi:hypothetical protein
MGQNILGGMPMGIEDHVAQLRVKHSELEAAIEEENGRPHPDDIHLHDLKRQKLRVKDEITRCTAH